MKDELGTRMKKFYENRTRILLPRRTYIIIRVDGRCFHKYCKNLERPFDSGLMADMNTTAEYLCKNIQGAKFAFVQSDEINILVTDFETHQTDAWFDGNIQKIVSVTASMATAKFNHLRMKRIIEESITIENDGLVSIRPIEKALFEMKLAEFDARTFTIPADYEVENYFIWRQNDCVRNSISNVAQSLYNHKELNGKNMSEQQDMIHEKDKNWNDFTPQEKRGRFVFKQEVQLETEYESFEKKQTTYTRNHWVVSECPIFTKDKEFLIERIPKL